MGPQEAIATQKADGSDGGAVTEAWQLDELGGEPLAVLTAGKAHGAGEQVYIDYGEAGWRSSWEMLYTYGFVPGTKPDEWLAAGGRPIFFECVQRSDPLWQQKAAVIASLTGDEGNEAGLWVDVKADPAAMAAWQSPGGGSPGGVSEHVLRAARRHFTPI